MRDKILYPILERAWRRSRTHLDRPRFKRQCHICISMMINAKSKHLTDAISKDWDNSRRLRNSINNILH